LLNTANDINDNGWIVGTAYNTLTGESHGHELVNTVAAPVPEPETYAMLLVGLGLIGFTAMRRKDHTA